MTHPQSPASPLPEAAEPVQPMDDDELQDFCISLSFDQDDYTVDVIRNVERRMLGQPLFQCSVMSNTEMDAAPSPVAQAPAQAGEVWRPIATAPQHGTILLWWRHAGAVTGGFAINEEWTPKSKEPREGWKGDGDEGIPRNQDDCTHWQVLRAPDGCKWPRFSDGHSTQEWFEEHYATPPAQPVLAPVVREPLTEDEIADITAKVEESRIQLAHARHDDLVAFARAIEAAHGIQATTGEPS